MSELRVKINLLLVVIAASYLTMGAANSKLAATVWWVYALLSGGLASANLILSARGH
jgi:hypothetical protein